MKTRKATRDSRKALPMPESKARLQIDRTYSPEEYENIKFGFIPRVMEDKWFIYIDEDWMHLHRSWTGFCIYQVRLERIDDEYMIAEASVNRDPNQYTGADTAHDARLLVFLIDRLLLGKDVPFPTRDARSSDLDDAIKMWHTVGRGRANDEEVIY